jgi:hypothetical protein
VDKKGAGDEAKCGAHSPHCLCVPVHLTDVPGHALKAHKRAATMKIDTYLRLKFRTAAGVAQLQGRVNMLRALWAQDSGLDMADALNAMFSNGATHKGQSSHLVVDGSLKTFSCALAAAADGCSVMDNLVAEVVAHFVVKGGDAHVESRDVVKGIAAYRDWADSGKKQWNQDRSADCFQDWDAMMTKLKAQTALPICEAFWKTHVASDGKCVSNQGDNYKKDSQLNHCRDKAGQPDTAWLAEIEVREHVLGGAELARAPALPSWQVCSRTAPRCKVPNQSLRFLNSFSTASCAPPTCIRPHACLCSLTTAACWTPTV